MAREWKPGDVAMVRDERGETRVAVRTNLIDARHHWAYDEVGIGRILSDVRPLVVIDAEDREQVERLANALKLYRLKNLECDADKQEVIDTQAALREFANPTPPKPDEPQGLGAVVEDADGEAWVQFVAKTGRWWRDIDGKNCRYADLNVVRVLSPGYTEDGA